MSQPQREDGAFAARRGSSCRYRLLQMSRLIKGSSIKLSEKSAPPPAHSMLRRGGARVEQGSSPLLTLAHMHPPRTPQVPVGAPPLKEGRTHAPQAPKWGCGALIPPARQATHPYFHLSGALQEQRRGDGLFGWVQGGHPLFQPDEFSNFLWLQCFVPNSRP